MRLLWNLVALLALLVLASGCVVAPIPSSDDSKASSLEPFRVGVTKKSEVMAALGQPTRKIDEHTFVYHWSSDKFFYFFTLVFLPVGDAGIGETEHVALIKFDDQFRLSEVEHIYGHNAGVNHPGSHSFAKVQNSDSADQPCGSFFWGHRCSRLFAVSPDGAIIAAGRLNAGPGFDGTNPVALFDTQTFTQSAELDIGDDECNVLTVPDFSPDGSLFAAGFVGYGAVVWEVATGRRIFVATHPQTSCSWFPDGGVAGVAFSENGKLLATGDWGGGDGAIRIWDIEEKAESASIQSGAESGIWSVAVSNQWGLVAGAYKGGVSVWRLNDHKATRFNIPLGHSTATVKFIPNRPLLAIYSCAESIIEFWDFSLFLSDEGTPALEAVFGTSFEMRGWGDCDLSASADGLHVQTMAGPVFNRYDVSTLTRTARYIVVTRKGDKPPGAVHYRSLVVDEDRALVFGVSARSFAKWELSGLSN